MKHLDLFSGIGGFALAADRVFGNVEHTFCEIDPFCQEVLKKHWPQSKIYGDIRTLTPNTGSKKLRRISGTKERKSNSALRKVRVDLLTGGFPCQPFSQAGQRKGTDDDRYLWPEMLRVIRDFAPTWVIAENVRGLLTQQGGMVFEQVCLDLEGAGYEVQPFIIPACAVNAPHRRDRVWIVANRISNGKGSAHGNEIGRGERGWPKSDFGQRREVRGHIANCDSPSGDVADTTDGRRRQSVSERKETRDAGKSSERNKWDENWLEVATRLCRMDDGIPRRMDRNPRLKALGNAIVPQVVEEIMKAIKSTLS